ncbi:AAA family ATPase [Oceanobacillus oncorhynchi]|uniref:AAA family ATPase n=1 Tax=Oceanobacillus oncorhynchi TaxID=545501 RepID=UPI0025A31CAC|nr:AAA family ATPase [Oceanobacillus oncorhynchi]MDM8100965.1 AAA family ATPase [Oceanobacillus oncorhynchi]
MNITKGKTAKAQKVVLYGPEGIGKSSFAAQFPDPIFIDTEGSTGNMDVARMDKPNSWTMLHQQIDFFKNNSPGKTLIVDTVDWAERLAIDFVVSRANKKSITGFGYGEGFIQLEEEFGKFLNKLSDLVEMGINVVLTAHAKITKFEQPDEMGAYDRWELKLGNKTTAKTAALTKEWADMVLFMNYKTFSVATDDKGNRHKGQGGERTIYSNHHPAWDAKNRHELPDQFKMDYNQIAHIFPSSGQAAPNQNQQPVQQPTQPNVQPAPQPEPQATTQPEQPNTAPPVQEPVQNQQSAAQSETNTTNPWAGQINPNLPKALQDLMIQNHVSEQEIQTVVGSKGYYPADTPITNYDESFIQGVLVGAWEQVFGMIQQQREANAPF